MFSLFGLLGLLSQINYHDKIIIKNDQIVISLFDNFLSSKFK